MKNNFYITFGVWLVVLPFLGIPGVWKSGLITASGLFLILVSIGPVILKKLQTESQSQPKPRLKKKQSNELRFSDNENHLPRAPLL